MIPIRRAMSLVLATCLLALPACSWFAFESKMRVTTEVYTGDVESRNAVALRIRNVEMLLLRFTELQSHAKSIDDVFGQCDGLIQAWEEGVAGLTAVQSLRSAAAVAGLDVAAAAKAKKAYRDAILSPAFDPIPIRELRKVIRGESAVPGILAEMKASPPPNLLDATWELGQSNLDLAKQLEMLQRELEALRAYASVETKAGSKESATLPTTARVDFSLALLAVNRAAGRLGEARAHANPDTLNIDALGVGTPAYEKAAALRAQVADPKVTASLSKLVFFTTRIVETAFGEVRIETIDPTDPRLRDRGTTPGDPERRSILAAADGPEWEVVYDEAYGEGDGRTEVIIVQESPLHYRTKSFDNDPTDVISLDLAFAEQAMRIVGEVLGKAAAVYGGAALSTLEQPGDEELDTGTDGEAAASLARARIRATEETVRRRAEAEAAQVAPYRDQLAEKARRAAELAVRIEQFAEDVQRLQAAVDAAPSGQKAAAEAALKLALDRVPGFRSQAVAIHGAATTALATLAAVTAAQQPRAPE